MTSGTSTPTRSCLKRRLHAAKNSISGSISSGSSSNASTPARNSLCKTVSFDGKDNVFFCDPDYDRHSVPVAPKLSYEDLLELKMLNVNMMCPQNRCAPVVPVGIMPLLPTSDSPPPGAHNAHSKPKQIPGIAHNYGRNQNLSTHSFVGFSDDDRASMSSNTPPPSSPSEHSPNLAPLPMIATDEEGQLIFQFSAPDEVDDADHSLTFASGFRSRRHSDKSQHVSNGVPSAVVLSKKLSTIADDEIIAPPFPVPPSRPTNAHSHAALTLTPSFFTLPPQPPSPSNASNSDEDSSPDSPFPFAPPVPTTTGMSIQPASAMTMTLSDTHAGENKPESDASVHATTTAVTTSPTSVALNHHRSTSSSSSTITPTASKHTSPTSPSSTPHASPILHMRSSGTAHTSQQHPVAGPLAALQLQHQHPKSPQLSGLPSPSLAPPSPLSLYPPSLELNTTSGTTQGGFFPERKKSIVGNAITGHVKRGSGSALARPTSPVVKPLKS